MCNVYGPAGPRMVTERFGLQLPLLEEYKPGIGPWGRGPYVRQQNGRRVGVVGQWALIGDRDKQAVSRPRMTNNARSEELAAKPTYRGPWARGQRCLIPAAWFREPCWEGGVHVPWDFRRADGDLWGLAGLWNDWTDPATGEIHPSYTMLTVNCDGHPLLARMHKPDPKRPENKQDKRAVIPVEPDNWDAWLFGTPEEAAPLMRVAPVEIFEAGPAK